MLKTINQARVATYNHNFSSLHPVVGRSRIKALLVTVFTGFHGAENKRIWFSRGKNSMNFSVS